MIVPQRNRWALLALNEAPLLLFAGVLVAFAFLTPAFFRVDNGLNVLVQASSTGILAIGMTFVLITAGVDLSVGAVMFMAAAVGGKLSLAGWPIGGALAAMVAVGAVFGSVNAVLVTRLSVMSFIVTLATSYIGRGAGLALTETRAMNLPDSFYTLGAGRLLGVPVPVILFAAIAVAAHLCLSRTPFGRQLHAFGADPAAARNAGINTRAVQFAAYVISGVCAATAAVVALSQAPTVSPNFGRNREFVAIAAAVLGGTSLFGGRGAVFPGTVLGTVLLQTIENGLNLLNLNPYIYPLVTSGVIAVALLLDAGRNGLLTRWSERQIFVETPRARRGKGALSGRSLPG